MTRTFEQNGTNDIVLDANGQISVVSGKNAYILIIADTVRTLKGEPVFATDAGVDYFNTVFQSASRISIWKHHVIEAVSKLPFVLSVVSLEANWSVASKTMDYTLVVETDEGSLTVSN